MRNGLHGEIVDTRDLKSHVKEHEGSSPLQDIILFVGWSGLLLFPCASFALGSWFTDTIFVLSCYTSWTSRRSETDQNRLLAFLKAMRKIEVRAETEKGYVYDLIDCVRPVVVMESEKIYRKDSSFLFYYIPISIS